LNPAGAVQGGFLAAMLDDTLGPALVAGLEPGDFAPATDLHVQFLRPAKPGRLLGRGRAVCRGREIGFLAGELLDEDGVVVAVATATVQIRAQMLREKAPEGVSSPSPVRAGDCSRLGPARPMTPGVSTPAWTPRFPARPRDDKPLLPAQ
jgi:uncharacterized protein (TIGR00369 family)